MSETVNPRCRVGDHFATPLNLARTISFVLFFMTFGLSIGGMLDPQEFGSSSEAFFLLFAAATTVIGLMRQLPGQNVLAAALIIGGIGGAVHSLGALTGLPFGPFVYADSGPRAFDVIAWFSPLLWIVAVLNSRGIARLILRPWRKTRTYGWWLIGLTVVLVLLLDAGLEPYATRVKHFWLWHPSKIAVNWYGAPLSNFAGWILTTLVILAFATPFLINKKPVKSPPDYHPLIVWNLLNLLLVIGALTQHFWLAAGISAGASILTAVLAIRGAQW